MCVAPENRQPQMMAAREARDELRNPHGAEDVNEGKSGECPVCLNSLSGYPVCMLPCKHTFHQECVEQLRKHGVQQVCPLCHAALPAGPNFFFEDATWMYVAVARQVGGGFDQWQSLTNSQQQKMSTVVDMYTNAADQGNADSQYDLSCMYREGEVVGRDHKVSL